MRPPPLITRARRPQVTREEGSQGERLRAQKSLQGKLADLLHKRKVKAVDLMRSYGKDGKPQPGSGAVSVLVELAEKFQRGLPAPSQRPEVGTASEAA